MHQWLCVHVVLAKIFAKLAVNQATRHDRLNDWRNLLCDANGREHSLAPQDHGQRICVCAGKRRVLDATTQKLPRLLLEAARGPMRAYPVDVLPSLCTGSWRLMLQLQLGWEGHPSLQLAVPVSTRIR